MTETTARFAILGPMLARVGDREIVISAERDRIVLAMLLLNPGKPVSVETLVEALWEDQPPSGARNQVQGCVSRLRKRLAEPDAARPVIVTEPAGYRMGAHDLDVPLFREHLSSARDAATQGRNNDALARYRAALGLWRGAPLAGIESPLVRRATIVLEEDHARALEECLQLELATGRAGDVVAELTDTVGRYPYREGLHGLLMLALYRSGRQADALAAYRHLAEVFRDDLGVELGADLRQLHQAILNRDPALDLPPQSRPSLPAAHSVPRELPPAVAGFTGRAEALDALDACLAEPARIPAPLVISTIAGTAGVGKTALAVQWGHQVSHRFPDGQLYLDLHGFSFGPPLRPIDALTALLGSLGTPPDQIPTDETQAAARYRSQLSERQMLIVLDNAGSAEQVRPLLPGSPGCVVLITSRDRLSGLVARDGARRLTLHVLRPDEATALLAALIGAERVGREPESSVALAKVCAYLPLALRIVAAILIDRPHRTISELLANLTTDDRLALMRADDDQDSAIRTALEISYQRLSTEARRMFRLLGLLPGSDATATAAAALAGITVTEAERLLDRLAGAHLIDEHRPGRYRFHDLMRLYASQMAEREEGDRERIAAVERLVGWYVHAAHDAVTMLYPHMLELPPPPAGLSGPHAAFSEPADALVWLNAERANLVATVVFSAHHGPRALACSLAGCLRRDLVHGRSMLDWQVVADAALLAAEHEGDMLARAATRLNVADLRQRLAQYPQAVEQYDAALALFRKADWADGEVAALMNGSRAYQCIGRLEQASDHLARALLLCEEHNWFPGVALNMLGLIDRRRGRLADALQRHDHALGLYLEEGWTVGEADTRGMLGGAQHDLGQLGNAHAQLSRALAMFRQFGLTEGLALNLEGLAAVCLDMGNLTDALDLAREAVEEAADDPAGSAQALSTLGDVQLRQGLPYAAINHYRRALDLARRVGAPHTEAVALLGVAAVQRRLGQQESAASHARRARDITSECGYRVHEGLAVVELAEISLGQHGYDDARDLATRALEIHRDTGYRLGEARASAVLGKALQLIDGTAARHYQLRAADILAEIRATAGGVARL